MCTVINKTKEKIIGTQLKLANKYTSRVKGLLGKRSLNKGEGLILRPCNNIHMLFMKIPLDIVFLKKNGEVIYKIQNLKPWRITPIVRKAYEALELPVGTIEEANIEIGDKIKIIYGGK